MTDAIKPTTRFEKSQSDNRISTRAHHLLAYILRSIIIHHASANAGVPCTPPQEIEGSEGNYYVYLIGGGVVVSEAECYLWDVGSESQPTTMGQDV